MHTLEYSVGDLVCLNAGHVVHCYDDVNCDSGPANPTRFGLTVNDYVPAIILDMKEDPEFGGEILLLVGLQRVYMNYQPGQKPELKKLS